MYACVSTFKANQSFELITLPCDPVGEEDNDCDPIGVDEEENNDCDPVGVDEEEDNDCDPVGVDEEEDNDCDVDDDTTTIQ